MKKISILLVLVIVLSCLAPMAMAAGSAYLSGPSTVRAGDTISITFYAGGGILGGQGSISYDSSLLTLQGYTQLIGGSWEVDFGGNNFFFSDDSLSSPISGSSAIFKATFTVNPALATGTAISVSANNVILSDGNQDAGIGSCSYSATIAAPLSTNAKLSSMKVSNATISPAFSTDVTSYSASVPYSVSSLNITAAAEDPAAKVSIGNNSLTPGGKTAVTVTVTAESGATKVYTITVTREQDPNYQASTNADLKELKAEGYAISPAFSKDVTQYYVWLPYEADSVSISAAAEDAKATAVVGKYTQLTPGQTTDVVITVTAEDGSQKLYTVSVFRAPAHEDVADFLAGERAPEPEPEPEPEPQPEPKPEPEIKAPATTETPTAPEKPYATPAVFFACCVICLVIGAAAAILVKVLVDRKRGY